MEEEHRILTCNGQMFSLPHFHFQFKSVNISTILTSKLKICVYVQRLVSWLLLLLHRVKKIVVYFLKISVKLIVLGHVALK